MRSKYNTQRHNLQNMQRPDHVTWQSITALLGMVGDHRSQLDGLRLYLPLELRRRLGELLLEPWIISLWIERCLRVVPAVLWRDYLSFVRRQVSDEHAIQNLIVRPARRLEPISEDPRWHLSYTQSAQAGIIHNDCCWICPNVAWLEIWNEKIKLERDGALIETLARRHASAVISPEFPQNPPSAADSAATLCASRCQRSKSP